MSESDTNHQNKEKMSQAANVLTAIFKKLLIN
jgi:hypothetical protein